MPRIAYCSLSGRAGVTSKVRQRGMPAAMPRQLQPLAFATARAAPRLLSEFGCTSDDLIGLAVTVAFGCALSWLCAQHPTALPVWAPWDFSWPEYLAAVIGAWWFLRGETRCAPGERSSVWRQISFILGIAAIYAAVQTRFDYVAQHEFFMNRIQHILMHHLGPFLIALAWPGAALMRGMPLPMRRLIEAPILHKIISVIQQPVLAGVLFVGLIYLFLIPEVHFQAMIDARLYAIMNWSMISDGILFWCLVLDPRPNPPARVSYATRLVLPFAVMFPQIAMGARIAFSPDGIYPYYEFCGRLFPSISTMSDQHIGGIVIWIPAGMMSAAGFMTVLNALRRHEDTLSLDEPEGHEDAKRIVLDSSAWTGRR
jgi:putative membrane protein